MKKLTCLLVLSLLWLAAAQAKEPIPLKRKPISVREQLAQYIQYPEKLIWLNREGTVVVQFVTDADHRIAQLQVQGDEQLSAALVKQLRGRKLSGVDQQRSYTIRLHYRLED